MLSSSIRNRASLTSLRTTLVGLSTWAWMYGADGAAGTGAAGTLYPKPEDPDVESCSYLAPGGGCEVLFSPGLSVCVCVCLSVYLCVRPIFWYFISRLLEEISICNLYRILIRLYSIH